MARKYRLFLSSPGDVEPERDIVEQVVRRVNDKHGENGFELYRWEQEHYSAAATFQDQIPQASDCDLVLCIFWKRLGSELPDQYKRPDGSAPTGSEFEFEQAIDAATSSPDQVPDIYVYRSEAKVTFAEDQLELETAQFGLLKAFWTRWFRNERGHFTGAYDSYDTLKRFEDKVERALEDWLSKRSEGVVWALGSPFRGLQPFDEEHAPVFFGRRREVGRARARLMVLALAGQRFLLVTGPSGSGKSSLVRAGVIPALGNPGAGEILPDQRVRIVTSPNQMDPSGTAWALGLARALFGNESLAQALRQGDFGDPETLAGLFEAGGPASVAPLRAALLRIGDAMSPARPMGAVVLVDQLEEVFGWRAESADAFCAVLEVLSKVAPGDTGVTLIATMRSEFRHRVAEIPALGRLVRFDVVPGPDDPNPVLEVALPSAADFRAIIEGPAQAAGLTFEPATDSQPALNERIEAQAQARVLPALQYLLAVLYDKRDGGMLTHAAFDRLGGVLGVMAAQGEEIIMRQGEADLPALVRALVKTGDPGAPATARRVPDAVLSGQSELVRAFVDAGLIVSDGQSLRLAHESLIAGWDRLTKIVGNERRLFESRERLADLSALHSKGEPVLLEGFLLSEGQDLLASWGPDLLADAHEGLPAFISASATAAGRKRQRRLAVFVSAAVIAVAAATSVAVMQTKAHRDTAFQFAMARSETATREGARNEALIRAVEAFDLNQTAQSQSLMMEKSLLLASPGMLWTRQMDAEAISFGPDGQLIAIGKAGALVEIGQDTSRVLGRFKRRQQVRLMQVLPDGSVVFVKSNNAIGFVHVATMTGGDLNPELLPMRETFINRTDPVAMGSTSAGFAVLTKSNQRNESLLIQCSIAAKPTCHEQILPVEFDGATIAGDLLTLYEGRTMLRFDLLGDDLRAIPATNASPVWEHQDFLAGRTQRSVAANDIFSVATRKPGITLDITHRIPFAEFAPFERLALDQTFLLDRNMRQPAVSLQPGPGRLMAFGARFDLLGVHRLDEELRFAKLGVLRHGSSSPVAATRISEDGTRIAMRHQNGAVSMAAPYDKAQQVGPVERISGQAGAARAFAALSETEFWVGYDAAPGEPASARSRQRVLQHIAMHPDAGIAAVRGDGAVIRIDQDTPDDLDAKIIEQRGSERVAFTRSGTIVAAGSGHLATPDRVFEHRSRGSLGGLSADPTMPEAVYYTRSRGEIWHWDIATDTHRTVVAAERTDDSSAGMSLSSDPSGRWLAATRADDFIYVYDVAPGTEAANRVELNLDNAGSQVVEFSPDGQHLAVLDSDGKLYLFAFDAERGTAKWVFAVYPAPEPVPFSGSDIRQATWIDWMGSDHIGVATAHGDVLKMSIDVAQWRAHGDSILPRAAFPSEAN